VRAFPGARLKKVSDETFTIRAMIAAAARSLMLASLLDEDYISDVLAGSYLWPTGLHLVILESHGLCATSVLVGLLLCITSM
jgi:hypothetical protein